MEVKGWHDAAFARNKVVEAVNRFKEKKVDPDCARDRPQLAFSRRIPGLKSEPGQLGHPSRFQFGFLGKAARL